MHSKYGAHRLSLHKHSPPNPTLIPYINMYRSVQPGGVSLQMRVHYTARRKLGLLTAAERLQREEGMTIRRAAEELLVAHSLIVKWRKQRRAGGGGNDIVALIKSKKKASHAGPLGQLKSIESDLLRQCKELHCAVQRCEALLVCPFICLSNRHAQITAQARGSSGGGNGLHASHTPVSHWQSS